jgi:ABC-type sugar transport system permease subunit
VRQHDRRHREGQAGLSRSRLKIAALRPRELSDACLGVLMNAPCLVCFALVLAYPVLYAGYLSLHEVSIRQLRTGIFPFAGGANFVRLLQDDVFWLSLRHTVVFVAASVALEVVIALAIALIASDERVWISRITRALILLPWAVPPVVNGLLWSFIFNAQYGYLNRTLHTLGLITGYVNWLGNPHLALLAVIVAYVWRTTPFNILLYHAALQGIPHDLYEAAQVDGASGWRSFWSITLPLLRPIMTVSLILRTAFAFMVFDEILAITQGGPGNDTWVAAWYTYKVSFQPPFNVGLGAAAAWVLALVVGLIAIGYVRFVYRRVEY